MKLDGIHHVTCITGDAQATSTSTPGRSGCGWSRRPSTRTTRPSTTCSTRTSRAAPAPTSPSSSTRARGPAAPATGWSTGSCSASAREAALDFWAERLGPVETQRDGSLVFADPEGLGLELRRRRPRRAADRRAPGDSGRARAPGLRRRPRLHVRSRAQPPPSSKARLRVRPGRRAGRLAASGAAASTSTTRRPATPGIPGAGTVHHVAWAAPSTSTRPGCGSASEAGARPTPVIDRFWFHSIYFREPSGVLFELATARPRLRRRRAARAPRREARPAAGLRAPARRRSSRSLTPIVEPAPTVAMSLGGASRRAAGEPEGALVLFHGRGADENDLYPLLDVLDPERRLLGVTPRAPLSLPPGGAHWYAVAARRLPGPGDVRASFALQRGAGSTGWASRPSGPCSAASRRAP